MAKYLIAAINYIASGDQRTLLNIDTQLIYHNVRNVYILDSENTALCNIVTEEGDVDYLPTEYIDKEHPFDRRRLMAGRSYNKLSSEPLSEEGLSTTIILNEQLKYGYDRHLHEHKRIMLYLSSEIANFDEKLKNFSENIYQENRTFVAEQVSSTIDDLLVYGRDVQIKPLYDIRDVMIKSCILKDALNSNLYLTDLFVDIYAPSMSAYPLEFCLAAGDAYMVTDTIFDNPAMMYSSLNWDRMTYEKQRDFYNMVISSSPASEYLYVSKKDAGISSYVDLSSSQRFMPVRLMIGIEHNYIILINTQQYPSVYDKGDIYALLIDIAKNSYDYSYSMNMSSQTSIKDCRQYCGINQFNNNVYLKFYDNRDYTECSSYIDADTGMSAMIMAPVGKKKYPFLKIEMYLPNSFKTASTHKSNLFSVKIKNKGIGRLQSDENDRSDSKLKDMLYLILKRDIKNACKLIADHAAPANTQFFDVFFEL